MNDLRKHHSTIIVIIIISSSRLQQQQPAELMDAIAINHWSAPADRSMIPN